MYGRSNDRTPQDRVRFRQNLFVSLAQRSECRRPSVRRLVLALLRPFQGTWRILPLPCCFSICGTSRCYPPEHGIARRSLRLPSGLLLERRSPDICTRPCFLVDRSVTFNRLVPPRRRLLWVVQPWRCGRHFESAGQRLSLFLFGLAQLRLALFLRTLGGDSGAGGAHGVGHTTRALWTGCRIGW